MSFVADFNIDPEGQEVKKAMNGVKTEDEVWTRLKGHIVKPETAKFYGITTNVEGLDVIFDLGENVQPRYRHILCEINLNTWVE